MTAPLIINEPLATKRTAKSALEVVKDRLTLDIDQLDAEAAARYGPFCDMTSNQALVAGVVAQDSNPDLVRRVVARAKLEKTDPLEAVEYALDLLIVHLAKEVLSHLSGRVHAQISPRFALSKENTLKHAHRLVSIFAREGIPAEQVCLKIPATGAGLSAAAELEREGIRTLATTLFSVDQAQAAAQAGCLYIAPYFNELSVHFEPETWVEYERPEREHPMSGTIRRIVEYYQTLDQQGQKRPLVMPASIVTSKEALALSTLGVDHMTVSVKVLQGLSADMNEGDFRGKGLADGGGVGAVGMDGQEGSGDAKHQADWLANEGEALDENIRSDPSVSRRLEYAVNTFLQCETKVAAVLRQLMDI